MRSKAEFVDLVISMMASEHGAPNSIFGVLVPAIEAAFVEEGQIPYEDLDTLCRGDENGEIPNSLHKKYPQLSAVFDAPFTGDLGWDDL